MLKTDLHVHTTFSRDGAMKPEAIVRTCLKKGISGLAVTDHNSLEGSLAVRAIAPFRVIPSEEIRTASGEIIGLFLLEEIPPRLSAEETASRIRGQGGLVCIPHPFDRFRNSRLEQEALERLVELGLVDIIEAYNARTTFRTDNLRAVAFAKAHALALSAGSDAHGSMEVGRFFVEMAEFDSRDEFLANLRTGTPRGNLSPFYVHFVSIWAKSKRRLARR
ncbi:MAG: PHP domain-containing protein [Chloroflexi bacterium]|nr:PHP domain-containing protein [Chloroflexota bacterium]